MNAGSPVSLRESGTFSFPILLYTVWALFSIYHTVVPDSVFQRQNNIPKHSLKPGKALRVVKCVAWEHKVIQKIKTWDHPQNDNSIMIISSDNRWCNPIAYKTWTNLFYLNTIRHGFPRYDYECKFLIEQIKVWIPLDQQ